MKKSKMKRTDQILQMLSICPGGLTSSEIATKLGAKNAYERNLVHLTLTQMHTWSQLVRVLTVAEDVRGSDRPQYRWWPTGSPDAPKTAA